MKERSMQPWQRSLAQEAALHEISSRLDAFGREDEAAPPAHPLGAQQQAADMLSCSYSVLALPGSQHWGTAQQAAGAHQRGLQCISEWSRSVQAMNAAPIQLQQEQHLQPYLSPSCAALSGGGWPYSPAAQFQSHQQACMDGFQRFLRQDASRAEAAPAAHAPTLPEVPAKQHPRAAVPVALAAPEQEPREAASRGVSYNRTAGMPSLPCPFARTALVPLTGLYAKDTPAAARQSWKLPLTHDLPEVQAALSTVPEEETMQKPVQDCNYGCGQPKAAEARREAAVPNVSTNVVRGSCTVDAPDLMKEHCLTETEQAQHLACSRLLDSSSQPSAAVEETDAEQHESLAADIPDKVAQQIQDPSRPAQAVLEDNSAASAPSRPVLAPRLPPAPAASRAHAAGAVQPAVVTSFTTDPEVPGPTGAVDLSEDAAGAMEALLRLANVEGVQAPEAQAAACLKPADAHASLRPEDIHQEGTSAAEQGPATQPAAADHPAAMPARCDSYEGESQCLDLVRACGRPQLDGRVPTDALHSSIFICGGSSDGGGTCIPVRACDMTLLSEDTLADLAALAPSAWKSANGMKLDVPFCRAPQPPIRAASAQGVSQMPQAVLKAPSNGQKTGRQQPCNNQHAQELALRPQATCNQESRPNSTRRGLQRAAMQELPAAAASEAASLAGPPQRQVNKELAMLQAEAVPEMDRLTKLSTAGHVTRHRASALSNRERRALLRQQGPVAGNPSARPARPGRPRAEKALRSSRVRPAPRSQIAGAERAGQAPGAGEQRPQLQSSAAVEDHNPSAKALTSSRIKPASKGPEGERVPGGKSSRLRQPLGTGVSVSAHRKACRPQAQEGQRLKLRQRSGTAGPPRLQSVLVRATRHAAGTSNLNPRTRRTARQVVMALPETREEAIRMRIGQCCTMTNARRDIGIMKVPHEVSLGAGCSRALSARVASKRKQEAAPNVPVGTSQARPVPESLDSTLVLQPASGSQLQAPNRETTVLDIAPAKDAPPARESTDMLVVLPAADGPAPGNEFARPQRQQAAVTEPCSEAAAVPPLALAQPDARPAEHASSAPCSAASKAPRKQTACRTVARRTEPCTEEAALLEVPLPVSGGSAAPCDEAVTCAPGRLKRVPGGDPLQNKQVARLCGMIRANSREFQADGRVLRLKQYVSSDVRPSQIDAILDALADNTRVEVLYIQNFEWGMLDAQLEHLSRVLTSKHIWALNVGENFQISISAWERFTKDLEATAVGYMYVSEHHLKRTGLKLRMRDAIRVNRKAGPRRDPEVICKVGNMWFNPKMPDAAPRRLKAVDRKAMHARPLVRQLAAARSANSAGTAHNRAAAHRAAAARHVAQELKRRRAMEYHPQVTPPKAYGPKRVAPEPFTHLGATGSVQQPKPLAQARLGRRAGRLATRPLDYDGPMLCAMCGVTQTPCWRRHHSTRVLLCNRCGVQVNALGAAARAHSTHSMRARRRAHQARSAEEGSASGAERARDVVPGEQVLPAQRASRTDRLQSSSPPQQRPSRKRPGCLTPVRRPPKKARYACEDCGAPVEQDMSQSPDTILCSACSGSGVKAEARRLQGDSILSPKQVRSMRAQVTHAVRAMQGWTQVAGGHSQNCMPGQHAMLSSEPEQASPQQVMQPGTEYRTVIQQIGLLSGTLRPCNEQRLGGQPASAVASISAADGSRALPCWSLGTSGSPATDSAALNEAGQHSNASQPDCSKNLPRNGISIEQGGKGRRTAIWQDTSAAAAASLGKRKLSSCAPEAERPGKRPCEGACMPEPEPLQALMPCPGHQSLAHGCSRDVSCTAAPEQSVAVQRRGSFQADSRVRMKQRELVPVHDLLAGKYHLPGRDPPKSPLSADEELLTLWLWTHKPRSSTSGTWAPSIRSKAC